VQIEKSAFRYKVACFAMNFPAFILAIIVIQYDYDFWPMYILLALNCVYSFLSLVIGLTERECIQRERRTCIMILTGMLFLDKFTVGMYYFLWFLTDNYYYYHYYGWYQAENGFLLIFSYDIC
jgi:hypothetical protein